MSEPSIARIAVLESMLADVRGDLQSIDRELRRTRERVHKLEASAAAIVTTNAEKIRSEQRASRRLEMRIQALTVVVLVAGVIVPLIVAVAAR